ncbi:amidohydrolase [Dasania sp. GY-MA-18]|uniref:Amidohydrolase n=1 Tax=Dasania phycosphaerae TaxID=2950436 RepID=A0A9J6RMI6_9GAMM|nr:MULTISPECIES: amidohydrolase [Dasania]MCR8922960.1 amidohydrolase [Dasania sp. GY-MA-18]MCZ0865391.1 amidohydrolase [Dasania phycosphaerae]MCZ0869116.1 amidohydrolase [Dasania phycosphaerae]
MSLPDTSFPAGKDYRSSHTGHGAGLADTVFENGRIYTVNPAQEWAEAVAVKDGVFVAVGSREEMQPYIDQHTQIVDLKGRFIMPGLYDMHTHPDLTLAPGYAGYLDVGLEDPTPAQVKQSILDYAAANPKSEWIFGQYFVHFHFKREGIEADRHWLDSFISDRPVAIHDRSWGCILVNSKALELAGIDANTPDPRNGFIERDGITGEPTGILVDGAYSLIHAAMPPTPAHALQRAYREGIHYQTSRGVVGTKYVHVCENRLDALKVVDDAGDMTLRVEAAISWQDDIFPVRRRWELLAGERHYYRSARLNANAVKFHFDGTHGSYSSYLSTPWPGQSEWRGGLNLTPEHIVDMVVDMDRRGIRVIAHCVGDGASDLFLDAVAEARKRNGPNGVRHQCAHSTVLLDENLPRFKALNVVAEFSPVGWLPEPYARAREVMGEERFDRMYNFKGVLDHGGLAVMGTDWPVSTINCWVGFEAMMTRKNPWFDNDETFHGEAISVADAIRVMTINGAHCMGIEDSAGSIEVGKSADFIALDRNLFELELQGNVHNTQVDLTMMAGQVVWDRNGELSGTPLQAPLNPDNVPNFYDK